MTLISSHDSNHRKRIETAKLTMLFYDPIDNSDGVCASILINPRPISQCMATVKSNGLNIKCDKIYDAQKN